MFREGTRGLFDQSDDLPSPKNGPNAPIANRMRPRTLGEYVGQAHLLGPGRLIREIFDVKGQLTSLVLLGPPAPARTPSSRSSPS